MDCSYKVRSAWGMFTNVYLCWASTRVPHCITLIRQQITSAQLDDWNDYVMSYNSMFRRCFTQTDNDIEGTRKTAPETARGVFLMLFALPIWVHDVQHNLPNAFHLLWTRPARCEHTHHLRGRICVLQGYYRHCQHLKFVVKIIAVLNGWVLSLSLDRTQVGCRPFEPNMDIDISETNAAGIPNPASLKYAVTMTGIAHTFHEDFACFKLVMAMQHILLNALFK